MKSFFIELICIKTNIFIYLYMVVNIMFYFKFKSSYVLSRMISKFYTNSPIYTLYTFKLAYTR